MKNKATPKKLLAMFLSLVLICTMLQCTLLTTFAEGEDNAVTLDDAYEINIGNDSTLKGELYKLLSEGLEKTDEKDKDFAYQPWNVLSDVDSCVRVKYSSGNDPATIVGINTGTITVPGSAPVANKLDGLEVIINNYNQFQTGPRAGFSIQFSAWEYVPIPGTTIFPQLTVNTRKGIILHFDLKNNAILINSRLASGDPIKVKSLELSDDDKARITLENFSHKAISIGMHATGDEANPYKVVIKLSGDPTPIVANIPAEYCSDAITNGEKVCIGFPAGYWVDSSTKANANGAEPIYTQFDVVGYRNSKTAQTAIDQINTALANIDANNVKESDAKTINKAINELSATYDTLTEWDKTQTNFAAVKSAFLKLIKEGITPITEFTQDYWAAYGWFVPTDDYARFNFSSSDTSPAIRVGATSTVDFDGLVLKFNNLQNTDSSAVNAGVGIIYSTVSGVDFTSANAKGLLLYIDVKNGNLLLNLNGKAKYKTLIENNEYLKYESLEYNSFIVKISATDDSANPYKVTITTADGKTVQADIPADCFDASTVLSGGKTYVTISKGRFDANQSYAGSVRNSIDFIGYTNTAAIDKVNNLIASIPETVTTNDGNVIYKAEQAYAALSDDEKTKVDGADKLTAARTNYDKLVGEKTVEEGYEDINDDNLVATIETINSSWFPGYLKLKDLNENGVNINWTGASKVARMPLKTYVNLDGFSLRFNNYKLVSGTCAELSILFSNNSYNQHTNDGTPHFAVIIDAAAGTLKVSTVYSSTDTTKQSYYDIIKSNDLLKYENLAGAMFTVDFAAIGEMEYEVTVNVAGESVSGIIPAQAFSEVSGTETTSLYNPNNCHFAVGAWSGSTQQIDVVGFKTDETVTATKIEGASLTVSDSISVNYKVNSTILSSNEYTAPEIDFTLADETINVIGELESGTGYYNFTFPNIAPNLMGETITATLYAKREGSVERHQLGDPVEYSVKEYCNSILEKYADDAKLCTLVVDLLNYGAESQKYTNKTENGLVNDGLTPEQKALATNYKAAVAGNVVLDADGSYSKEKKLVTWKAASLFLADVVNIRFKFTLAEDVSLEDLTVKATVGEDEVEVSADCIEQIGTGSSYYLYFDGATAARMRDAVAITFYNENGDTAVSKTVNYSIQNYIGTQVEKIEAMTEPTDNDVNLVSMLKALLCYGDSAAAYASK